MYNNLKSCENIDGTVTLFGPCVVTKDKYEVTVPGTEYRAWMKGDLIQRAMPSVNSEDLEFLISGTSPDGWAAMFPQGDDD